MEAAESGAPLQALPAVAPATAEIHDNLRDAHAGLCLAPLIGRATDDGADIVDALIAECAASAGCKRTVTFDKSAAKAGMSVLR
jgi:predicted nucleic acid-binding protein